MKKKFIFLLLPLLLTSCLFDGNDGNKEKQPFTPQTPEEEQHPTVTQYEGTFVGNSSRTIMEYGSQYQIKILFDGQERNDIPLNYRISKSYCNDITVSNTGLITAPEYNRARENVNEFFEVCVSSVNLKSQLNLYFVITNLHKDTSINNIIDGENFHFYESTGIIENLVGHESEPGKAWYAECTLHDENTGESIYTTISKSYGCIALENKDISSHFKTIIKRDESGSKTVENVKNGTKVKFLTMPYRNESCGYTNTYNSIIIEELSHDDRDCDITCYDPEVEVSKMSGKYEDTFIVTRPEGRLVSVYGEYGLIWSVENLGNNQTLYKFDAKHITIYTDQNASTSTEYGSYPVGVHDGSEFTSKEELNSYLFGDSSPFHVTAFNIVSSSANGFKIGTVDGTSDAYISIAVPESLRIVGFSCRVQNLSSGKSAKFNYHVIKNMGNGGYSSGSWEISNGSGIDFTHPNSGAGFSTIREINFYLNPRGHSPTYSGFAITNLKFYQYSGMTLK